MSCKRFTKETFVGKHVLTILVIVVILSLLIVDKVSTAKKHSLEINNVNEVTRLDGVLNMPNYELLMMMDIINASVEDSISRPYPERYAEYLYLEILEWIKLHEGYRDTIYQDLVGLSTICYGHLIKSNDRFNPPLDKCDCDKILEDDFNYFIKYVADRTDLKGHRLLAMAHFAYCLGTKAFNRMYLFRVCKHGHSISIQLRKYIHINSKPNNYLRTIRNVEIRLYRYGVL